VKGLFKRKKKEKLEEIQPEKVEITDLEKICADDREAWTALRHTMFLDPRKIQATLEDAVKKAADFEKKGNSGSARVWYHIAGGLALWKGDAAKVKQYFGKCEKLAPEINYGLIMRIPERAVKKAQEYYQKFLK